MWLLYFSNLHPTDSKCGTPPGDRSGGDFRKYAEVCAGTIALSRTNTRDSLEYVRASKASVPDIGLTTRRWFVQWPDRWAHGSWLAYELNRALGCTTISAYSNDMLKRYLSSDFEAFSS